MKTSLRILFTVSIVALFFFGCDKIKNETDVEFESTFNADLECVVPAGSREINGNFNASAEIDLASDPTVNKYLNNIKSCEILSITGTITAISKDVTISSMTFNYSDDIQDSSWTYSNQAITMGTFFQFYQGHNEIGHSEVWGIIVSASGTTDENDVTFTIGVAIKTKFVANPL